VLLLGPVPHVTAVVTNNWDRVLGGLHFARREPLVLLPMLLDFTTRGCGSAGALLPIFARDVFVTGPEGLGWLASAMSAGAVAGGLAMGAFRREMRHPVAFMMAAYAAEGIFFAGFAWAPGFAIAVLMLFLKGIANVFGEVPRITVLQMMTPDELRGRVTALSGMFDLGGPQIGQLSSGAMADAIGPVGSVLASGVASTLITVGFAFAPGLRTRLWAPAPRLAEVG
jgi:MFS family permease